VLTVVEGLAIGGGDLAGARPLGLGEDLLLDLEVGLRVVVVELGERVGTVRRGWRALSPPRRPCLPPVDGDAGGDAGPLVLVVASRARSAASSFARASSRRERASTCPEVRPSSTRWARIAAIEERGRSAAGATIGGGAGGAGGGAEAQAIATMQSRGEQRTGGGNTRSAAEVAPKWPFALRTD
jgi:hypothetical protein